MRPCSVDDVHRFRSNIVQSRNISPYLYGDFSLKNLVLLKVALSTIMSLQDMLYTASPEVSKCSRALIEV
jgi:hypothetical protein